MEVWLLDQKPSARIEGSGHPREHRRGVIGDLVQQGAAAYQVIGVHRQLIRAQVPPLHREVLAGRRWGFEPSPSEVEALPDSVRYWLPFPDTVSALRVLKSRYELAIISNVDDGLFALTARYLEVEFDYIITAEQAGTYKPSLSNFELALKRMGAAPERILHVAESLFHDHVPAKKLGLDTAWVHRRAVKGLRGNPPGGGRLRHRGRAPRCRWSSPSGSAGGQPGYVSSHSASSSSFRLEPEGRRRGLRKRISLLVMGK